MTSVSALGITVSVASASPATDRLDGAAHDFHRHQRPDRVVDHDDVVVGGIQAREAVARALVARRPAGDDRGRDRQPGARQGGLGLGQPGGVGDDHDPVDAGGRDPARAAHEDLLTGEAHELLGDVGAEAIAVASGEQERVDSHRSSGRRLAVVASRTVLDRIRAGPPDRTRRTETL